MHRPSSKLLPLYLLFPLFFAAICLFHASLSNAALSCCRELQISEGIRLYCFNSESQGACYGSTNPQTRREKKPSCCRWRRNEEVLNVAGSELIINNASLDDYGNYSCGSLDDNEELFTTTIVYPDSCLHGKLIIS